MEHNIRKCKNSDGHEVYRLVNQLKDSPLKRSIFLDKYISNLLDKNIEYWLIENQDKVVGFISIHNNQLLHHDEAVNEIQEFVIDEPFRNIGLGSKLLLFILNRFNYKNVELASNKSRLQSALFYEKHGFKVTHKKFTL